MQLCSAALPGLYSEHFGDSRRMESGVKINLRDVGSATNFCHAR